MINVKKISAVLIMQVLLLVLVLFGHVHAGTQEFRVRVSDAAQAKVISSDDVTAEINFGREVAAHILGRYKVYRNEGLNRYVNLVGKAVALHCNRSELDFRFAVLDTSTVNAYSAPGGYVFITLGAIEIMEDESELAAVMAHEIAHTAERHIVLELGIKGKEQSAEAGIAHLLGAMGDPTRVVFKQAVDGAMGILFQQGYSQQDERSADQSGTIILASTGYDPSALIRYLGRLKAGRDAELEILNRTHPPLDERIATLNTMLTDSGLDKVSAPTVKERFDAERK